MPEGRAEGAAFTFVQARRNKAPQLVPDHRKRQDEPAEEGDADRDREALLQLQQDQAAFLATLLQRGADGPGQEVVDRVPDEIGQDHRHDQGQHGPDDPRAQFLEMFDQGGRAAVEIVVDRGMR